MTKTIKEKKTKKTSKTKKGGGLTGIMDPFSFMRRPTSIQKQRVNQLVIGSVNNDPFLTNDPLRKNIEIYWIRHAHSCANMIESFGAKGIQDVTYGLTHMKVQTKRGKYSPDPHITNFGISHAYKVSQEKFVKELEPDIIFVSQLLRTWETAYTLFYEHLNKNENNNFYVCPFINEERDNKLGTDLDNQPDLPKNAVQKFNQFKEYLRTHLFEQFKTNVNMNINYISKNGETIMDFNTDLKNPIKNITSVNESFKNNYLSDSPDYNNFMAILPRIIKKINTEKIEETIKIVIVTHSKFIQNNITKNINSSCTTRTEEQKYPRNCDIFKQYYKPGLISSEFNGCLVKLMSNIDNDNYELLKFNNFEKKNIKTGGFEHDKLINEYVPTQPVKVIEDEEKQKLYLKKLYSDQLKFLTEDITLNVNNKDTIQKYLSLLLKKFMKKFTFLPDNLYLDLLNLSIYNEIYMNNKKSMFMKKKKISEPKDILMFVLDKLLTSSELVFKKFDGLKIRVENLFWKISLGLCNNQKINSINNVYKTAIGKYFDDHPVEKTKIINLVLADNALVNEFKNKILTDKITTSNLYVNQNSKEKKNQITELNWFDFIYNRLIREGGLFSNVENRVYETILLPNGKHVFNGRSIYKNNKKLEKLMQSINNRNGHLLEYTNNA